jgi:hypothetical protein
MLNVFVPILLRFATAAMAPLATDPPKGLVAIGITIVGITALGALVAWFLAAWTTIEDVEAWMRRPQALAAAHPRATTWSARVRR